MPHTSDRPSVRQAKRRASTEAQRRCNRQASFQKLWFYLAENFDVGDLVLTATYDGSYYPVGRRAAEASVKRFIGAIRKYFRARHWSDPVSVWVTEEKHGDGRLHHHIVLRAPPGKCYKALSALWRHGALDIKHLRVDRERNYETLARYLCKESPELGKHQWHSTRNVGKPDISVRWVDGDTQIRPPKGSLLFESYGGHDYQHGASWQYSLYILPLMRKPRRGARRKI